MYMQHKLYTSNQWYRCWAGMTLTLFGSCSDRISLFGVQVGNGRRNRYLCGIPVFCSIGHTCLFKFLSHLFINRTVRRGYVNKSFYSLK